MMQKLANVKKILFISEALSAPFDEGIKNVAFSIHQQIEKMTNALSITKKGSNTGGLRVVQVGLNKLFLNNELRKLVKNYSPDIILYLPEASITFNSFVRAKVLKLTNRSSKVFIFGVKSVEYSSIQRSLIVNFLRPDLLLLLGRFDEGFFQKKGLKVKVLPPAVDSVKFCQAAKEEKEKIRAEFNIPINKKVVLHVGHIRSTRNVISLTEIQKIDNVQVVVIGSSSTPTETNLKNSLVRVGIRVIDEFVPDIQKIYKMADIYIFPVFNKIASIDMPLSILEAMACNLPVITTRFGSLVDYFEEDADFRYFNTVEELVKLVKYMDEAECHNSKKIEPYTWNRFVDELIAACNELIADSS